MGGFQRSAGWQRRLKKSRACIKMKKKRGGGNWGLKRLRTCLILLALLTQLLFAGRAAALNRYLRVGFNANLPPFQFIDQEGACAGMHIDILKAIGEERGYEFEFQPYETNLACREALDEGEIDLILGVVSDSVQNDPDIRCTATLTSSQLCMIVDNETLSSGARITTAIFASDSIQHTLLAHLGIHQFIAVGNQRMVYERHKRYPGSAMIGIKDSLLYQLINDGADGGYTVLYNYLDTIEFSLVLRGNDGELLRTMDESIARFKAGQQYEAICNKWLPSADHGARSQRTLRTIITVSILALVLVLGYSLIMRRIQQVLKRRVAQQTEQIQKANTELEKQFAQIQDENDLRNRIIKYSPSGMLLFDLNYTITMMNKSARTISGLADSHIGGSALEVPVFGEILRQEADSVFTPGTTVENGSIRIGASPGSMRSYSYMMYQVNRYGKVAGTLLSVQDMTKVERMQQAEFEKERSLSLTRIAAGIAHEIRNPLMSIRTFAALIGTRGDDKQVQQSFARYVPDEVDRINRLIENLIHYAMPAKRRTERILVSELAEDSLALIRPVLRRCSFHLMQALSPELYILADRDQIRQVLINILINGIEAMEQKAARCTPDTALTLELRVEEREDKVAVIIRDEGVGMTAEELNVCKDPFFSTKETGTGLGLALCEQYIKENNGTLEIDSMKGEYTQISLLFERS